LIIFSCIPAGSLFPLGWGGRGFAEQPVLSAGPGAGPYRRGAAPL